MSLKAYGYVLPPELHTARVAPPLHAGPTRGSVRVAFAPGTVRHAPKSWAEESDGLLTVGWAGYAEYAISTDGPDLAVAVTLGDADVHEASLCLSITVIPLALPLLGLEPFHGSAVKTGAGAVIIVGARGRGKSTLASALVNAGYPLVTDDACAVDADGRLWPGPPLVSLRERGLAESFAGDPVGSYNEKSVLMPYAWEEAPMPVAAIVALEPNPDANLAVRRVGGGEALSALLGNVRAPSVLAARRQALQLATAVQLCHSCPVGVLSYAPSRHGVIETAEAVAAWSSSFALC